MAVVDNAERDVVPELGVPLLGVNQMVASTKGSTYGPMSDGVSDWGGGRLISVGVDMITTLGFTSMWRILSCARFVYSGLKARSPRVGAQAVL